MPRIIEDTYLGDGVYASWDGYHLWLDTRAQDPVNRIALEPAVLEQLDNYRRRIQSETDRAKESA